MKPSPGPHAKADFSAKGFVWGESSSAVHAEESQRRTVTLTGPDTDPSTYELAYFFGKQQMEQHLVMFPDGRLQALPFAYDTVAMEWFDLFEDDPRGRDQWGHWKNPGMTANSECLYCHTTDYSKGYNLETNTFETTFSELGVGCEACHGPGQAHATSAESGDVSAVLYATPTGETLLDTCASCHSLRRLIREGFTAGDALLDFFDPILLDEPTYHPDGSVDAEAYEWSSYLQSRMYREGVACADCHDSHSGELLEPAADLCLSCHENSFATQAHHHHPTEPAPMCVDCHMPTKVFMQRDSRRDHSFSLPNPQLTVEFGIPNACSDCHATEPSQRLAETLASWFPNTSARRQQKRDTARAFEQGRNRLPTSIPSLIGCLTDCDNPISRASAAKLLAPFADRTEVSSALLSVDPSEHSLVRNASVWAVTQHHDAPPADALPALRAALSSDLNAIRDNAAWGLRFPLPEHALTPENSAELARAYEGWIKGQLAEAEDPESHHNLGLFWHERADVDKAIAAYETAIRLNPAMIPSHYNLALLLVEEARSEEAIAHLRLVVDNAPHLAEAAYRLGTLYAKQAQWREAISAFANCMRSDSQYPGALFALADAYVQYDEAGAAVYVLSSALKHEELHQEALLGLVHVDLLAGDHDTAREWAELFASEYPEEVQDYEFVLRALGRTPRNPE